jgi:molybdenum cofactor cytidylyltransferase
MCPFPQTADCVGNVSGARAANESRRPTSGPLQAGAELGGQRVATCSLLAVRSFLPLNIVGILLAAGSGSRFGGGKLLHPLRDGTPIGVTSLRNLKKALPEVIAVVRAGDDELSDLLESEGVAVTLCEDARLGMAHSLACAIRASMNAGAWVIALGDMPYLAPATIRAVARQVARSGRIIVPAYRGERGHPVGFGSRYRADLLDLEGDQGARSVVRCHTQEVEVIECDDPGILRDIDAPDDAV